jgi:hypothetical protein
MSRLPVAAAVALMCSASAVSSAQQSSHGTSARRAGASSSASQQVEAPTASGGAWSGRASKWGGSPIVATQRQSVAQSVYLLPMQGYLQAAVPVPQPVAGYAPDTVYVPYGVPYSPSAPPAAAPPGTTPGTAPVDMPILTSRTTPQLTTMDVYRQQRFARGNSPRP